MADPAVSFLIEKLASFLSQEVELWKGVHEEVAKIKDDLEAIQAFLQDADLKASISQGVKLWVKRARESAYQLEDAMDKYMILHMAPRHDRQGFAGFLQRISTSIKLLPPRREIALELQRIRKAIQEVKNNANSFQLIPSVPGAERSNERNIIPHDPRHHSLAMEEVELVGIELPRNELISLLVSGTTQRKVIPVVGLGGVGKTTIAKKVYDNQIVKNHFECHAWITVSQSYDKVILLRSILQQFHEEKKEDFPPRILTMEASLLIGELKDYLRGKRFVVVFDDVWDTNFWGDMEHALLDNNNGGRILVTTRNEGLAIYCKRSSLVDLYRVKLLTDQQAWELFCKKAFKFDGECPKDLEELSHQIVRRCGGLPLAIVAVGGVLTIKEKKVAEWERLLNSLDSAIVGNRDLEHVSKILSLSYSDLPYNLKSCFLYLGMFPEDFSIKRRRLISLWVAGGFVQEKQGMTQEEVAEEYLEELIHRSLVQVDKPSRVKNIPRSVRVHDLIRDVILSKSEELNFSHASSNRSDLRGIARHLSLNSQASDNPKRFTKSQTRSIMFFDKISVQKPTVDAIFATSRLLTILDFEGCPINHIPNEIGKLLHLRYLNLRYTLVSELPKSIGELRNLQYIFGSQIGTPGYGLTICSSIGHLELLQTLCNVRVYDKGLIEELGMLKQLSKLGITSLKREYGRDLCTSLEKMTNLQSLFLKWSSVKILEVQSMSSPPQHLQTLKLEGKLERLPEWIPKLYNLSKLRLFKSRLTDDPIKILQALPSLASLDLWYGYDGERMYFEEGGFQQLKWLRISGLHKLNTMIIDEGIMPSIQVLAILHCRQLEEVPSGIQHLKGLKALSFARGSAAFERRLFPSDMDGGGEDYLTVKHVPSLYYNWKLLSRPNDETGTYSTDPYLRMWLEDFYLSSNIFPADLF